MRRRTTALVAAAIGLLLLAATGRAAADAALPVTYAPMVYLAQGESKRPANVADFLRHSSLGWSHRGCPDHELAKLGTVSAAGLGNGSYEHQKTNVVCQHTGSAYASNQDVRPNQTWTKEGMYLDLDDSQHDLGSVQSELYYDYKRADHITYWFFYAYDDGPLVQNHEGDWERISIRLDADDRPVTVAYFQHGGYCLLSYASAPKTGGHLRVFSASGTHASYSTPGDHPTSVPGFTDHTSQGEAWPAYDRPLHDVRTMPWFGFGGAWGEVGEAEFTTGPRGPSAFKNPVPADWSSPAC
ncbi:hypothetical protein [Fodinicola acaciae]|uniref:hypothetical protein n=1 Tax=Fodinicola acaciae TaxID=2681555 RepID=UPI0013D3BC53|nr:hypothetical protein [Fodinicola acaciae]